MHKSFQQLAGYSLIIGAALMLLTMALHPAGGNINHILKISNLLIISHSIGILSTVFTAFGIYGLAISLISASRLSMLGLCFAGFALVAVLLAGLFNGIILPTFVSNQSDLISWQKDQIHLILDYGFSINAALDYVFIIGFSIAILFWSFQMLRSQIYPRWLGFWGFTLIGFFLLGVLVQINFISLKAFKVLILVISSWIMLSGYFLINFHKKPTIS